MDRSTQKLLYNWLLWPLRAAFFRAARRLSRKAGLYR